MRVGGGDGRLPRFCFAVHARTPYLEIFRRKRFDFHACLREIVERVIRLEHRVVHHRHDPIVQEQPPVADCRSHVLPHVLPHALSKLSLALPNLGKVAGADTQWQETTREGLQTSQESVPTDTDGSRLVSREEYPVSSAASCSCLQRQNQQVAIFVRQTIRIKVCDVGPGGCACPCFCDAFGFPDVPSTPYSKGVQPITMHPKPNKRKEVVETPYNNRPRFLLAQRPRRSVELNGIRVGVTMQQLCRSTRGCFGSHTSTHTPAKQELHLRVGRCLQWSPHSPPVQAARALVRHVPGV